MSLSNKFYIRLLFFIVSFCFNLNVFSQIDLGFIRHLSENNLKKEHWTYINEVNCAKDSTEYHKAKFYLQYHQDSLFLESFKRSSNLFLNDSFAVNYACVYFIKNLTISREDWFLNFKRIDSVKAVTNNFYQLYQICESPSVSDTNSIPQVLQKDFLLYVKAYSKKPIVAACLSAIIPGLGELYIGNFRAFISKLISQSIFGFQIVEVVKKVGILHPLSILNSGFFMTFYGVNIIGSYRDTKLKMKDTKNQYLINVSNHYTLINKYTLY